MKEADEESKRNEKKDGGMLTNADFDILFNQALRWRDGTRGPRGAYVVFERWCSSSKRENLIVSLKYNEYHCITPVYRRILRNFKLALEYRYGRRKHEVLSFIDFLWLLQKSADTIFSKDESLSGDEDEKTLIQKMSQHRVRCVRARSAKYH